MEKKSPFERQYFITPESFNYWARKHRDSLGKIWRDGSKMEKDLKKFREELWPKGSSLTKESFELIKRKLERERIFGKSFEERERAEKLLKMMEEFEKSY